MSQCQEDLWILENLKPEPGFFVEVGAFDGIQSSNTLAFEDLGWKGLLIEADPLLAAQSQASRKSPTVCCGVSNYCGFGYFQVNLTDRGLSGFKDLTGVGMLCPVSTLDDLFRFCQIGRVSLLSIDTEGTELLVWAGCNLRPGIVIIEHQTCDEPSNIEPILRQMTKDGYQEVHRTEYNSIFTRD